MRSSAIWGLLPMSKGGRPPADAGDQSTRQVRLYPETAEMLIILGDLTNRSAASIAEEFIRQDLDKLWAENREDAEKMRATLREQEAIRKRAKDRQREVEKTKAKKR